MKTHNVHYDNEDHKVNKENPNNFCKLLNSDDPKLKVGIEEEIPDKTQVDL